MKQMMMAKDTVISVPLNKSRIIVDRFSEACKYIMYLEFGYPFTGLEIIIGRISRI